MNRYSKIVTFGILILYAVLIAVGFCCCLDLPVFNPISHHSQAHHDHHGRHAHQTGSNHSHQECEHPEILADLMQQASLDMSSHSSSLSKVSFRSFLTGVVAIVDSNHSPLPLSFLHGTGPPGRLFSPNPPFLQVLRI